MSETSPLAGSPLIDSRPWRLSLLYRSTPRCPACGVSLQPQVVQIAGNVLFCEMCTRCHPDQVTQVICHHTLKTAPEHWQDCFGVAAYVPKRRPERTFIEQLHHDRLIPAGDLPGDYFDWGEELLIGRVSNYRLPGSEAP